MLTLPQAGESEDTVEKYLFEALVKLKLITDRKSCNYSRCGRTDRGVNAFGQIVSLSVRTATPVGVDSSNDNNVADLEYCTMLNKVLPEDVRAIGWCEVTPEFSARFSAAFRRYRYFFVRRHLDVEAMREATKYLIGKHDFRNLCKIDVSHVSNFERDIYSAEIKCFQERADKESESVYMLEITGLAFLWHMVRCIMAVLFLIGEGRDKPSVVAELLNIEKHPSKPNYMMAPEGPLVLHECGFDSMRIKMQAGALWDLSAHFKNLWERHMIAGACARNAALAVEDSSVRLGDVKQFFAHKKLPLDIFDLLESSDDNLQVQWKTILSLLSSRNIRPRLETCHSKAETVPLLQRSFSDTYEQRRDQLQGSKKVRILTAVL